MPRCQLGFLVTLTIEGNQIQDLRSHVRGRSNVLFDVSFSPRFDVRKAEINQFDTFLRVNHDIWQLDIAVRDFVFMEILHGLQNVFADFVFGLVLLIKKSWCYRQMSLILSKVLLDGQVARLFEKKVDALKVEVDFIEPRNVPWAEGLQNVYFNLDWLITVFLTKIHQP